MVGVMIAAGATFRVIGSVTGVFVAPAMAIEIEPVYVPASRFAGLSVTVRLLGVVPAVGETESHPVPVAMVALAVKLDAPPVEVDSAMVWVGGFAPPTWKLTADRPVGF